MEILDLYNKDLQFTGKTIERGVLIPEGYVIPIVAVIIRNDKGEFLIQKVSKQKGNYFAITAGHVQSGEFDFGKAMCREIREEIGLDIDRNQLRLIEVRKFHYKFTYLFFLKLNYEADEFVLQEEEVDSVVWMDFDEIVCLFEENMFQKSHYQLLLDYVKSL
jgi:ADP-ribose pyrophosphatase